MTFLEAAVRRRQHLQGQVQVRHGAQTMLMRLLLLESESLEMGQLPIAGQVAQTDPAGHLAVHWALVRQVDLEGQVHKRLRA